METTYPYLEIKETIETFLNRFEPIIIKQGWNIVEIEYVGINNIKGDYAYAIYQWGPKTFGYNITNIQRELIEQYGFTIDERGTVLSFNKEIFESNNHLWSAQELNLI